MTMTIARQTDWRRSTEEWRTTNRIMSERQSFATRIVLSFGQGNSIQRVGPLASVGLILHHRARWLPTTCWAYLTMTVGIRGACSGAVRSWPERKRFVLWVASMGDFVAALSATLRSELR